MFISRIKIKEINAKIYNAENLKKYIHTCLSKKNCQDKILSEIKEQDTECDFFCMSILAGIHLNIHELHGSLSNLIYFVYA